MTVTRRSPHHRCFPHKFSPYTVLCEENVFRSVSNSSKMLRGTSNFWSETSAGEVLSSQKASKHKYRDWLNSFPLQFLFYLYQQDQRERHRISNEAHQLKLDNNDLLRNRIIYVYLCCDKTPILSLSDIVIKWEKVVFKNGRNGKSGEMKLGRYLEKTGGAHLYSK